LTLGPEVVERALPPLRHPADAELFSAEVTRAFEPVVSKVASGTFYPVGWYEDFVGPRGHARRMLYRLTTRARAWQATPGRRPLIATDGFSNGFFHWITETLPRLEAIRGDLAHYELVLPVFARRFAYMTQSLEAYPELRWSLLEVGQRWRVRDAEVLPIPAPTGNYRPALIRAVRTTWRERVGDPKPHRALYISRARAARRRIVNEDELRPYLERQGFETVVLEDLPFEAQVRLLAETKHLVTNHGAGLTHLTFMAPGTRVTEIRLEGDGHNNCYFSLARALDVDYDYRLASGVQVGRRAHNTDLHVDVASLAL